MTADAVIIVDVTIPGPPPSQGSMTNYGRGRMVHPPKLLAWRNDATRILRSWGPLEAHTGPYRLDVIATHVRPTSHLTSKGAVRLAHQGSTPRIDLDKTCRACNDVLKIAGVIGDDVRNVELYGYKQWADHAATRIVVTDLTAAP